MSSLMAVRCSCTSICLSPVSRYRFNANLVLLNNKALGIFLLHPAGLNQWMPCAVWDPQGLCPSRWEIQNSVNPSHPTCSHLPATGCVCQRKSRCCSGAAGAVPQDTTLGRWKWRRSACSGALLLRLALHTEGKKVARDYGLWTLESKPRGLVRSSITAFSPAQGKGLGFQHLRSRTTNRPPPPPPPPQWRQTSLRQLGGT